MLGIASAAQAATDTRAMLADTMMRGLLAPMQVVVEHCGANAPATQPALQAEASRIETAYRAAVERFVARIPPPTEQQLADGQADLPALTQEIGNRVRSAIRPWSRPATAPGS
jgi:2-phospho-L-lactate guanylyltransferase (CobY/MobA/RfbA family)